MAEVAVKNILLDSVGSRSSGCRSSVKTWAELGEGTEWRESLSTWPYGCVCVFVCVCGGGNSWMRQKEKSWFPRVQPLSALLCLFSPHSFPPPPFYLHTLTQTHTKITQEQSPVHKHSHPLIVQGPLRFGWQCPEKLAAPPIVACIAPR